jgi:hypothetical protein
VFVFIRVALAGNDRTLKSEAGIVENAAVIFLEIFMVTSIGFSISSLQPTGRMPSFQRPCRDNQTASSWL